MFEGLTRLFDTTGFPARKYCGDGWTPPMVWLHVTSDLFIWLAYLSIPLVLLYFTKRRDLPFPRLFVLFALFILACGTTHFVDALMFEYPIYRFAGVMKFVTAVVSWATVLALVPIIPRVMHAMTTAAGPGAVTREHRALSAEDQIPDSRTRAYIVALLAGVLAVLVRAAIDPLVEDDHVFVVALLAVVYVSWQHGFGPAILCLCVSVAGYTLFFVAPRQAVLERGVAGQLAVALFFFCGAACAALGEAQRQAARRAKVALATAVAWGKDLEAEVKRRRIAEAALAAGEERYRRTVEASATPTILHADDDQILIVNPAFTDLTGYTHDDVPTISAWTERAYGQRSGTTKQYIDSLFASPVRVDNGEWEITTASGEKRVWHFYATPVGREPGGRRLIVSNAIDVTEQKRSEAALREGEARFRTLAQAVPQIVWVTRPDGYHEYYNDRWYAYTGLTPEQSIGHGWSGPLHPGDVARAEARWRLATDTGEEYEIEYRFRGAEGRYRWFLGRALPQRDAEGRIARWYGTCTDIHNEKMAAERVAEANQFLEATINALSKHVAVLAPDGTILKVNAAWRRFAEENGLQLPDHGVGRNYLTDCDMCPPDGPTSMADSIRAVIRGDAARYQTEYPCHSPTEQRWFAMTVTRFPGDGPARVVVSHDNITPRIKAEAAIRESEAFRKSVFENSPDCVKILGLDGRVLEMNEAGCRLMDIDDFCAVRGEQWSDLWPPGNRAAVRAACAEARDGEVSRFQGFCPTAKGAPKYWDVSVAAVPSAAGTPHRLIAVSRDVTEQRRAEERVRESEERFRQLAESIPQLAWMTDADGSIFWYNQRWYDYTGAALEDMKGWGWQSVHDPDELPRVVARWKTALAAGEPWEDTFPLRGADGAFRWHLSRARPFRDATGAIVRWFGTNTDITAQREMEQSLRASNERFRTLAEAVPQMVWTADPRGEVTSFNRRWDDYTGLPIAVRQQWTASPVHPDDTDRVRAGWQLAVAAGAESYSSEFRLRRAADGEYRWMLSAALPLRDVSGAITEWVGSLTDIDDQKRQAHTLERMVRERTAELEAANTALTAEVQERQAAENQVREVATELERSNGELEKFAYIASHDLQEPLRKIQAFGDRLRNKCRDALSDNGKEYVDRMMTAAGRMRRLIDDLLTFSRVTTQKRPFVRLNMEKLVREVVSDLDVRIGQANGTVRIGSMPAIDADPTQMRQLFQNLIANAVKFNRPGVPPVVEVSGELAPPSVADGGPMIRFYIKDNGIGFDEKYRERIFDVFQRLHGRDEYEGTGVGLAICRKIAERHGGAITAHSKEGEGATFVVLLPASQHYTCEANSDDVKPEQAHHHPDGRR